jgi:hypothetical protein
MLALSTDINHFVETFMQVLRQQRFEERDHRLDVAVLGRDTTEFDGQRSIGKPDISKTHPQLQARSQYIKNKKDALEHAIRQEFFAFAGAAGSEVGKARLRGHTALLTANTQHNITQNITYGSTPETK